MRIFFLLISLIVPTILISNPWEQLLEQYKTKMDTNTYQLLVKQHKKFASGKSPAIANPIIKKIEIKECGEPLVDLKSVNNARIGVMDVDLLIKAHSFKEDIDPRGEKYSFVRKGVYNALCRMIKELDKLAPNFGYEPGDLEIKLFEGLRDLTTQKQLFDEKLAGLRSKNPELTEQEAYEETCKFVSPYIDNIPTHSTGAAVDIALYSKKTGTFCDMGRFNTSVSTAPTFSEGSKLSIEQQKNRLLLLISATSAGLTNYLYEFWHFSYGDRYDAYWRESDPQKRLAKYSAVK
ncbi:MAG: M15 family metallopeptidase [bacterium]|nr:M15 family metallopeptidase [bacterium]